MSVANFGPWRPMRSERKLARAEADKLKALFERMHKRTVVEQYVKDESAILDAIADRDDFRAVILGQAFIENTLVLLVERYLHVPDKLDFSQMGFGAKLALAESFEEVDDVLRDALIYVARLRNRLAHGLGERLTAEDPKRLLSGLKHADLKDIALDLVRYVNNAVKDDDDANHRGLGKPPLQPLLLPHQSQVRAIILMLQIILRAALNEPPKHHPRERIPQQFLQAALMLNAGKDTPTDASQRRTPRGKAPH